MIALVTDSTAYLTRAEAQSWNVYIAPMTFTVDNQIFHETYVDCNGTFENMLADGHKLMTSQPNMAVFMSAFEELTAKGYDVICLTISSRLSGTYSTASIAAKQVEGNIHIVDSRSISGGLRFMIMNAYEMIQRGMAAADIANELRAMRDNIGIVFSVDDMGPLRRGGRLGVVRQSVGTILNVKPILRCIDGGVVAHGTARGRNDQVTQLTRMVPENAECIMVYHLANERGAKRLQESLRNRFRNEDIPIRTGGPVLGIHLGLGVLSAQYLDNR